MPATARPPPPSRRCRNCPAAAACVRPIRLYPTEAAEADLEAAGELGACFIALNEADYPPLLRQTDSAPPLICVKGDAAMLQNSMVAVVGARNASAAGRRIARDFASALGRAGLTVISGLARGIDTAAHEAALETGTIAVLAGGVDVIYPPENKELHHAIAGRGCLVSEMTPGTLPRAEHFPRRNRLISGTKSRHPGGGSGAALGLADYRPHGAGAEP